MANVKISELPIATSLSDGDSFPVVQGGVTKQAARSVLFAGPTFTGTTTAAILTATGDVTFDGGEFVFNDSGADKDARFEGDTDANLLFLDASTDRVGIGTATPAAKLDVNGNTSVTGNVTLTGDVVLANDQYLYWGAGDGSAYVRGNSSSDYISFGTVGVERMRLDASGNLIYQVNGTAPTLSTNSTMSFELTSNTSLKIVVRGTDGTTRSVSLTLA